MAITKKDVADTKMTLEIDNGDFQALEKIKSDWGFADESSVFRFALAVLTKAKDKVVHVSESGKQTALSPADSLLKKKE